MNERSTPTIELKQNVWAGDSAAYSDLQIAYLDESTEEFLFWALLMANKYNYSRAYLDVYYSIKYSFIPNSEPYDLGNMDSLSKKMALSYLKIAADRDVDDAREILNDVLKHDSTLSRYIGN